MGKRSRMTVMAVVGMTVGAATVGLALSPSVTAAPASAGNKIVTVLAPLNGSTVGGTAWAKLRGNKLDMHMSAQGLVAGMPHAAHIHFGATAAHECPTLALDTNKDGRLSTVEGVPAYGPVAISLTTSGDTSPASVLAVSRFDSAANGAIGYHRMAIPATTSLVKSLHKGQGVLVIHGVDYNGNGVYDGAAGMSELDPTLPREATDPAACGVLR